MKRPKRPCGHPKKSSSSTEWHARHCDCRCEACYQARDRLKPQPMGISVVRKVYITQRFGWDWGSISYECFERKGSADPHDPTAYLTITTSIGTDTEDEWGGERYMYVENVFPVIGHAAGGTHIEIDRKDVLDFWFGGTCSQLHADCWCEALRKERLRLLQSKPK